MRLPRIAALAAVALAGAIALAGAAARACNEECAPGFVFDDELGTCVRAATS